MGKETDIAYVDSTWSPFWGCSPVSDGCKNCYAKSLAKRFGHDCFGSSPRRMLSEAHWREPLKWNAAAQKDGRRRRVFPSMCDIFEDNPELDDVRGEFWTLVQSTPHLDWLLLTKRPQNVECALGYLASLPRNVWLGVTGENQEQADKRWDVLAGIEAPVRFMSVEPQLGPVSIAGFATLPDWIICGCESGPRARPFDLGWARLLRDHCVATGVAFFLKQIPGARRGSTVSCPELDGRTWTQMPGGKQ